VRSSLDYTFKISQFKQKMELTVVEHLLAAMNSQSEFHEASNLIYKSYAPGIIDEEKRLKIMEASSLADLAKKKTLEDASTRLKPGASKRYE
jgi:hypothetical protein